MHFYNKYREGIQIPQVNILHQGTVIRLVLFAVKHFCVPRHQYFGGGYNHDLQSCSLMALFLELLV